MTKSEIKKTVKMVEEIAGEDAARKLVIAVKAKGQGREGRQRIKEHLERENPGDKAEVRERMKGIKPGFLMRAADVVAGYYVWEGDFVGVYVDDGEIYSYEHTGEVDTIRPEDFTLSGARWMDQYAEMVDATAAIRDVINHS